MLLAEMADFHQSKLQDAHAGEATEAAIQATVEANETTTVAMLRTQRALAAEFQLVRSMLETDEGDAQPVFLKQ